MKVLVTGGAGYIGSVTAHQLRQEGFDVVIMDNFSSGTRKSIPQKIPYHQADLKNLNQIRKLFRQYRFEAVIHFAGLISVSESVANPWIYYENNVLGSLNLLRAMIEYGSSKIVFSSTAAVYGNPKRTPIKEHDPKCPINPYGKTKLVVEELLRSLSLRYSIKYVNLRYFNAAGADGVLGENHANEIHLIPLLFWASLGKIKRFSVYGRDYPTKDGTAVRDFIHVLDLARAHTLGLKKMNRIYNQSFNVGTGKGYSVQEVYERAEKISSREIPVSYQKRRPGDPAILIADSSMIRKKMGWRPQYGLNDILESAWEWEQKRVYQSC